MHSVHWKPSTAAFCVLSVAACGVGAAQTAPSAADTESTADLYSFKTPARDGIGKVYMGREISFVMGHRGRDWLERPRREREERTDLVVEAMGLEKDQVVADIGAGSGYFSLRIAPRVHKVLAVDIQPEMLLALEENKRSTGVANVEGVLGSVADPNLPVGAVDAVLMVDAYHEFSHPHEMKRAIFHALRPGGKVFLVEYRGEDPNLPIYPLHKMTVVQARREFEVAGFEFVENRDMLPSQHFMVFRKPAVQRGSVNDSQALTDFEFPVRSWRADTGHRGRLHVALGECPGRVVEPAKGDE